jgi:engulfment/cell motility protein 1
VDSATKFHVKNGLENLPERIEVAAISEISTGTCVPPPNVLRDQNDLPVSQLVPSALSFSLLSAHEGSLADQIAPDESRWADWRPRCVQGNGGIRQGFDGNWSQD